MSSDSASHRDLEILGAVRAGRQTVLDVTHFIHAHPEVAHEEQSAWWRIRALQVAAESALGLAFDPATPMMPSPTDFGNVCRQVPSAMTGITREGGWAVHTEEGERQFLSPEGDDVAVTMSEILALAVDRTLRSTF